MAKQKMGKDIFIRVKVTAASTVFTFILIAFLGLSKLITKEMSYAVCAIVFYIALLALTHYYIKAIEG